MLVIVAVNVVLLVIFLTMLSYGQTEDLGFGLIITQIIITIMSLGKMENYMVGFISFLGRPLYRLAPGAYYALPLLMEVWKERGTIFQDELPANPEKIFRQDDTLPVPEGMFPPIRVKFGPPDPNDGIAKDNPYNKEMTVEVVPVISWQIEDAIKFRARIGSVEQMRKILEDKAISLFNAEFAHITPAKASRTLEETSNKLKVKLQSEVTDLGVTIHDAFIKPFIYSHDLNKSVIAVSTSEQKALKTRIDSAAEKQKRIDEGAGTAEARRLLLEAEAVGTQKLAELAKTSEGQIVLWMETLKTAMEKAQFSIIPGSEAYSALSGLMETFKRIGK